MATKAMAMRMETWGVCISEPEFAEEFAKGGLLPPYVSVWIPNFIYAFIAYYLYKKAPK